VTVAERVEKMRMHVSSIRVADEVNPEWLLLGGRRGRKERSRCGRSKERTGCWGRGIVDEGRPIAVEGGQVGAERSFSIEIIYRDEQVTGSSA